MPRPDSCRFVWADQAERFTHRGQGLSKRPDFVDAVTAEFLRYRRLRFDARMFHVKLCAADYRVAVGSFALGVRNEPAFTDKIVDKLAFV